MVRTDVELNLLRHLNESVIHEKLGGKTSAWKIWRGWGWKDVNFWLIHVLACQPYALNWENPLSFDKFWPFRPGSFGGVLTEGIHWGTPFFRCTRESLVVLSLFLFFPWENQTKRIMLLYSAVLQGVFIFHGSKSNIVWEKEKRKHRGRNVIERKTK